MLGVFALALWVKLIHKYTRERYAFAALGATTVIVTLTITSLTTVPPWTGIAQIVATLQGGRPVAALPQGHWSEGVLVIILAMYSIRLLHKAFVLWDGPVSVKQREKIKLHESTNFLAEGLSELRRVVSRGPSLDVYTPRQRALPSTLTPPSDSIAWRDVARELLELRFSSYYFDDDQDWHQRAECWIGRDTKMKKPVAVLCVREEPHLERIASFIHYVERAIQDKDVEFLIAVESTTCSTEAVVEGHRCRIEGQASLLEGLIDFGDYISDIRKRVENTHLPDSELCLRDVYVGSRIANQEGSDIEGTLEQHLLAWFKESGQRQLAMLGEYGQGKSTGALMFTYHALTGAFGALDRIPLLIELRGKSPAALPPLEFLGAWASNYRIDPRALLIQLRAGRLCLILEGFDEMSSVADPEARLAHFRTLWRFCFPRAKILITGRPNLFLDDNEIKSALGIARPSGAGPYCEAIHLKPFTIEQMHEGLRWTSGNTRQEIIELARIDGKFLDIASRPSLLYIVALLWNKLQMSANRKQMSAASVMGSFVDHCYRRQTEKQRELPHFMVLTESERRYFTTGLAAFMVAKGLQNQLTRPQFEEAITSLYGVIPETLPSVGALAEAPARSLKERLAERDDALDAVMTDIRTYGLLVRDHSRFDALKFPHKSFFEYLFGCYVAQYLTSGEPELTAAIRAATNVEPEDISDMPEARAFAGEVIAASLPPSSSRPELLDRFFGRIVFRTARRIPLTIQRVVLWESAGPMLGRFYTFLTPRFIVLILCQLFLAGTMFLGLLPARPKAHRIIPEMSILAVAAMTVTMFFAFYSSFLRRKRHVLLWLYISRSLGFSLDEIASVYGQRITKALALLADRWGNR